ncbi:MAG: hypothetical protein WCL50_00185 [Spirochaetota bacterium]
MKKLLVIMGALALATVSAFAATTALDTVGTAYSATDGVIMIGLYGNVNSYVLRGSSVYGATTAGQRASPTFSGSNGDELWLRFTLHGKNSCKVTVVTDTAGYVDGSIEVDCMDFQADGSAKDTLGAYHLRWPYHVPIKKLSTGGAQDLVTGISGVDTWTGLNSHSGGWLMYALQAPPGAGVTSVNVIYTIMEE